MHLLACLVVCNHGGAYSAAYLSRVSEEAFALINPSEKKDAWQFTSYQVVPRLKRSKLECANGVGPSVWGRAAGPRGSANVTFSQHDVDQNK